MSTTPQTLASGRYRLVRQLGQGGMATVWQAWDQALGAWRAIKVLDASSPRSMQRFENEARAMARLRHPHVLTVHDVGHTDEDRPYLVMEFAPGGSLADLLARAGPLPPTVACHLTRGLLEGLDHAHQHGIVHRDVKPQNVLLDRNGEPLVADFGIARIESVDLTRTGAAMGTLSYMAPEQRSSARDVDARADVYAAGGTLFALLTGREPLDLYVDRADWSGVPEALLPILRRATAWDRDDRFPTARAFADALAAVADRLPEAPEGFALPLPDAATLEPPADEGSTPTFEVGFDDVAPEPVAPAAPRVRWWAWGLVAAATVAAALAAALLPPRAEPAWVATELPSEHLGLFGLAWDPTGALVYGGPDGRGGTRLWRDPLDGTFEDLGPWGSTTFELTPAGQVLRTDWWAELPLHAWSAGIETPLPIVGRLAKVSPDGERVAYVREGRIEVQPLAGGEPTVVGKLGTAEVIYDLGWSPDARWLLSTAVIGDLSVQLWPVAGGPSFTLVEDGRMFSPVRTTCAVWVGDEVWIARGDGEDAVFEAFEPSATRPPPREVMRWKGGPWPIFAASRGDRVAVATAQYHRLAFVSPGPLSAFVEVPIPGFRDAAWAGDRLVAVGKDGLTVDGAAVAPISGDALVATATEALVLRKKPGAAAIDVVGASLAGGPERPLLTLDRSATLDCAHDGRCVVATPVGNVFTLSPLDPVTGALGAPLANVALRGENFAQLALSPVGSQVALFELGPEVVLVDLATGGQRRVSTGLAFVQYGAFTPDGNALLTIGNTGQHWAFARVPLDGSPPEILPERGDGFSTIDVAADGRVVVVGTPLQTQLWSISR